MGYYRIPLPYQGGPPLHANSRYTEPQERRIIGEVKDAIGWLALAHKVGKGHGQITVRLEWRPAKVRRRDGNENVGPMVKALVDGLVNIGVVSDDTPDKVIRDKPVLLTPDKNAPGLWFVIETE
jgi:crossover junction endodeoxyribonuclease RusA